ncbi:pirin family protein [Enterobacter ludwigii]|uniref:pirin family protein n=1 Tax=Enterobacter ludwigii TaxID=299767 RepID=UPI00234CFCE5|nr:pirin family protein [Enterobacter ludwigii]MDC7314545.1 pirin family protein [Enterobacter ludwigii]MDI0401506.1 pirin family protein [Enterobacter ludwigii]MDI0411859.1 pirin family protein [Enterobacter ludwigii]MDI0416518.1 pirin family protein [Enterobacter ludwigii]MDI0429004.1 pirin family protein [Enterobacter ludwigii]
MMKEIIKIDKTRKRGHQAGGFGIDILWPGLVLNKGDSGIGGIGRIDHAAVSPGTVIPMHSHKDDEILTYLRSGLVRHLDTEGNSEEISPTRLMLMGAGHTFQHEEQVLNQGGKLEGLQIFLRPVTPDLKPCVQFHDFDTAFSLNQWRNIAGPDNAPMVIRSSVWIQDARLEANTSLPLPVTPAENISRLIYVFAGQVNIEDVILHPGESLLVSSEKFTLMATAQSDVVLFTTDIAASVFKGGMFSGNILSHS